MQANATPATQSPLHGEPQPVPHAPQSIWSRYIFSTDHKVIALQYTLTGLFMAVVGVYMSYVFRMHLARPNAPVPFFGVLSLAGYNALVTNHGTVMIFWVAMPILLAGLGNYCIPLMIGAYFKHLNIEKKFIWYLLIIGVLFLLVLFFGLAPDVMKNDGLDWMHSGGDPVSIAAPAHL